MNEAIVLPIVHENVIWIDNKLNLTLIGTLSEDNSSLKNVEELTLHLVGKHKSMYVAKVPENIINETHLRHLLPVKISFGEQQKLEILPTKILYFNR